VAVALFFSLFSEELYLWCVGESGGFGHFANSVMAGLIRVGIFLSLIAVSLHPRRMRLERVWFGGQKAGALPPLRLAAMLALLSFFIRYGYLCVQALSDYFFRRPVFDHAVSALHSRLSGGTASLTQLAPDDWAAIFVAPVVEEIIYRGVILSLLLRRFNATVAVVLSALVFATFHGSSAFFPALMGGLYLGFLLVIFQRLDVCVLAHSMANLLVSCAGLGLLGESVVMDFSGATLRSLAQISSAAACLLLLGVCSVKYWRRVDREILAR
jgi:membrane protease YdiL (CAAX protease family)